MSLGHHIPLGTRIPDCLHAVSVSIPTLRDVVGYEEKEPATLAQLKSGYPRFVKHELLRKVEAYWQELFDKPEHAVWPCSSEKIAREMEAHLAAPGTKFQKHGGVSGLRIPNDPELLLRAKLFLQHTGGILSSRQAEDYLAKEGVLAAAPEELATENPEGAVLDVIQPLLGTDRESIVLANGGMNAFYAAFQTVNALQAPKGRRSWIKFGWMYTDTMSILDKFSPDGSRNVSLYDVFDLDAVEAALESAPGTFAGIVTETPTNPLIQSGDLARLRELATRHGAFLILDPTTNSPANVDVSPYADILVHSLTKYAASRGDVLIGAAAVQAHCPERDAVLAGIRQRAEAPYRRDVERLAFQIGDYLPLMKTINANTLGVVAFLESHPAVARVHWALSPASKTEYAKIARSPDAVGGMLSFDLKGDLAAFYDRVPLPKGPSFGMSSTLLCPFMYLAHYELVTTDQGRELLGGCGIDPELIRFSVGAEPVEEIIAALKYALQD